MGWRIVKQPNGEYARFSEVVDGFTHINMNRSEAIQLCTELGGELCARFKLSRADASPERFEEAMGIIADLQGKDAERKRRKEFHAESPVQPDVG